MNWQILLMSSKVIIKEQNKLNDRRKMARQNARRGCDKWKKSLASHAKRQAVDQILSSCPATGPPPRCPMVAISNSSYVNLNWRLKKALGYWSLWSGLVLRERQATHLRAWSWFALLQESKQKLDENKMANQMVVCWTFGRS